MVTVSHYIAKRCPYIVGGQLGLLSVSAFSGGNELFDFGFQQGEMSHDDSPHNIVGHTIIAMYHIVAGIDDSSRRSNFYVGGDAQQSIHRFTNYGYISLYRSTEAYVGQIYVVAHGAGLKK